MPTLSHYIAISVGKNQQNIKYMIIFDAVGQILCRGEGGRYIRLDTLGDNTRLIRH